MTARILITLCVTLSLAACGGDKPAEGDKKDKAAEKGDKAPDKADKADGGGAPQPDVTPPAPPTVAKIDLASLKIPSEGWEGQYNEALEGWTFEKYTPAEDGTNEANRFYIDFMADDAPRDVEAYAKKLQEDQNFQDLGYLYTSVDSKETLANGWLIVGVMKDMNDPEDKGERSFVLYRSDKNIYCRSGAFVDAKLFDEAIAACKAL